MSVDDAYTYPNSGGVLRNSLDILDRDTLDEAMNDFASVAWGAIRNDNPQRLDFAYLQSIHQRMFDRLFSWAGQVRNIDAQAMGSAIHPFRDGNTRSQSAFVSRLAARAGHPLDWAAVDVDELRDRRIAAVGGSDAALSNYLRVRLLGPDDSRSAASGPFPYRPLPRPRLLTTVTSTAAPRMPLLSDPDLPASNQTARCSVCGQVLTSPRSIARGYGPKCARKQ